MLLFSWEKTCGGVQPFFQMSAHIVVLALLFLSYRNPLAACKRFDSLLGLARRLKPGLPLDLMTRPGASKASPDKSRRGPVGLLSRDFAHNSDSAAECAHLSQGLLRMRGLGGYYFHTPLYPASPYYFVANARLLPPPAPASCRLVQHPAHQSRTATA